MNYGIVYTTAILTIAIYYFNIEITALTASRKKSNHALRYPPDTVNNIGSAHLRLEQPKACPTERDTEVTRVVVIGTVAFMCRCKEGTSAPEEHKTSHRIYSNVIYNHSSTLSCTTERIKEMT